MKRALFAFFAGLGIVTVGYFVEFSRTIESERELSNQIRSQRFAMRATSALPAARGGVAFGPNLDRVSNRPDEEKEFLSLAERYLSEHQSTLNLQPYHRLTPSVFRNPLGATVRYSVYQDNLPLVGISLSIEFGRDHSVKHFEHNYRPFDRIAFEDRAFLNPNEILQRSQYRFSAEPASLSGASSVLFVQTESNEPELAYWMSVRERAHMQRPVSVLFRAVDGQVLQKEYGRSEQFAVAR